MIFISGQAFKLKRDTTFTLYPGTGKYIEATAGEILTFLYVEHFLSARLGANNAPYIIYPKVFLRNEAKIYDGQLSYDHPELHFELID